jgi:hypothetical protein
MQPLNGFGNTSFTLTYNKAAISNSSFKKLVTYDSTIQDIKTASSLNYLNNPLALALITIVKNAQYQAAKHPQIAKTLLVGGAKLLNDSEKYPILISQDTYSILLEDFTDLENSL